MSKNILKILCLFISFCIILSGCSTSVKEENEALKQKVMNLETKNSNLESKINELSSKLKDQEIVKAFHQAETGIKDNIYGIYTADIDTYEKRIDAYVYIPKGLAMKKKLQMLANILSEAYFEDLPIQVLRLDVVDNKKIAVVNLSESKQNQGVKDYTKLKGNTWRTFYMQGSTGGTITSARLIETFLQREYSGQWIDGVKFLYNKEVCDYEHAASLKDINYR